jgi:hypothetical protein
VNPTFDNVINPGPDLDDPNVLAKECADYAEGMQQQALAAQQGTALGGHPYPAQFYSKVAEVLAAAAKHIAQSAPPKPAPAPAPHPAKK